MLARAIKEHERREGKREGFSDTPGDVLAYKHYRDVRGNLTRAMLCGRAWCAAPGTERAAACTPPAEKPLATSCCVQPPFCPEPLSAPALRPWRPAVKRTLKRAPSGAWRWQRPTRRAPSWWVLLTRAGCRVVAMHVECGVGRCPPTPPPRCALACPARLAPHGLAATTTLCPQTLPAPPHAVPPADRDAGREAAGHVAAHRRPHRAAHGSRGAGLPPAGGRRKTGGARAGVGAAGRALCRRLVPGRLEGGYAERDSSPLPSLPPSPPQGTYSDDVLRAPKVSSEGVFGNFRVPADGTSHEWVVSATGLGGAGRRGRGALPGGAAWGGAGGGAWWGAQAVPGAGACTAAAAAAAAAACVLACALSPACATTPCALPRLPGAACLVVTPPRPSHCPAPQALPNWSVVTLAVHPVALTVADCAKVESIRRSSSAKVRALSTSPPLSSLAASTCTHLAGTPACAHLPARLHPTCPPTHPPAAHRRRTSSSG